MTESANNKKKTTELFVRSFGKKPVSIKLLPKSASYRTYFKIEGEKEYIIGAHNADRQENEAFLYLSRHFDNFGLPVPKIIAEDLDEDVYLLEYLGATTLFNHLCFVRTKVDSDFLIEEIYKKVIDKLVHFQITASKGLDFSRCFPRAAFDEQSIFWDLNYFKYYFLKLAKIPFHEQELESDFKVFTDYLLKAEKNYFLYRDLQSRNIMIHNNEPYFIDYQGGRQGALQYDLASLLFDAKADLSPKLRNELIDYYIIKASELTKIDAIQFKQFFDGYLLIRIMQALGAYGFRGWFEGNEHLLTSIPLAQNNLRNILLNWNLQIEVPVLKKALNLVAKANFSATKESTDNQLTVTISSFSYLRGIPNDASGNGGGFVFDCRAIHNPGRFAEFAKKTGADADVQKFLEKETEMPEFVEDTSRLVCRAVDKYIARGFKNLSVNFGCTGGQHRSVYASIRMAQILKTRYNINIVLQHLEQEKSANIR